MHGGNRIFRPASGSEAHGADPDCGLPIEPGAGRSVLGRLHGGAGKALSRYLRSPSSVVSSAASS